MARTASPHTGFVVVLNEDGLTYQFCLDPPVDRTERLQFDVTVIGDSSRESLELHGMLPCKDLADLARVGRLLLSASARQPSSTPAGDPTVLTGGGLRRGTWTAEEVVVLRTLAAGGSSDLEIASRLGRTNASMRWKLYAEHLGPFPTEDVRPATAPAETHTPAYRFEELRREHANSHRGWTPEDDERLRQRHDEGATTEELMEEFGHNFGAITGRLGHLRSQIPDGAE